MSPQEVDLWYRALREWRTREVGVPRHRPPAPTGGPVAYWARCPMCRRVDRDRWDTLLVQAMLEAQDTRPLVREIACATGIREELVRWHLTHLDPDPPHPIIGEWAYRQSTEMVLLPTGWVPASRVMAAIRESPHAPLLLRVVRGQVRRRSLLSRGRYRDGAARRIGEAVAWLAAVFGYARVEVERGS